HAEQAVMLVTLGQQAEVVANQLAEIEPGAVDDQLGSAGLQQFDGENAEVAFEAAAPGELDGMAGLQGGGERAAATAAHQAEAAPTPGDHGLGYDAALAVATNADQQGVSGPFHLFFLPSPLEGEGGAQRRMRGGFHEHRSMGGRRTP